LILITVPKWRSYHRHGEWDWGTKERPAAYKYTAEYDCLRINNTHTSD